MIAGVSWIAGVFFKHFEDRQFFRAVEQAGGQMRMGFAQAAEEQDAPGHQYVQSQGPAQRLGAFHLPCLHLANVFEHLMPAFDAPLQPIPSDQTAGRLERVDFPIGQEHPLDRLGSLGRIAFSGQERPELGPLPLN